MSKSNIVFQLQYKIPKNKKIGISKWIDYASRKQKADSTSIDEYNILKDYSLFADKDSYVSEDNESYIWNGNGDLTKKDVLNKISNMNNSGIFWRGFLSFPQDFAIEHGLITKMDFFSLTNNVMPSLILDMGLDINNTEWMCTLHRDTKNPHLHICIYEKISKKTSAYYNKSCIYNLKSNVANYLIDNEKFYKLRDKTFNNITGTIDIKELNKIKSQRLYSDDYRKQLNKLLLNFYSILPKRGRLQYNSKNLHMYKKGLDSIINFILLHDSVKYDYAKYLRLLEEHQKELNQIYGMSDRNKEKKYYNDQLNKLYSKIGNEILNNFKVYQSVDVLEKERQFLQKHIKDLNFKSRRDYSKIETREGIAKDLYKICLLAGLNDKQIKKIFEKWNNNSKYSFDIDSLIIVSSSTDSSISIEQFYNSLKKLGYDYEKYSKLKSKYFYQELNYKSFMNKAINHLTYELEQEEKQIIEDMQYDLEEEYRK